MRRLRIAIAGAGIGRGQAWLGTLKELSSPSDLYDFCAFCEVIEARSSGDILSNSEDKQGVARTPC